MALHIREFRPATPADRVPADPADGGYFYVGEAARILDLDLDYRQIRTLFLVAREQRGLQLKDQGGKRWSRFTLEDLACVRVLVDLCGGAEALRATKRLRIKPVRDACIWLRDQGVANPLLEVDLEVEGSRVFASFNGTLVETRTGQLVLGTQMEEVAAHLGGARAAGVALLTAMRAEVRLRSRARPPTPVQLRRISAPTDNPGARTDA